MAGAGASAYSAVMAEPERPEFFVSYSHHDDAWRRRLIDDFVSTTFGDCVVWSDARIRAGDDWAAAIDAKLASCSIAVLLASPRFLASQYIGTRELPCILARARAGGLRIVWIPIALTRAELEARQPALAGLQAAMPLDDALPADVQACEGERLARLREQIRFELQRAVDPLGAELSRLVGDRYRVGLRVNEGSRATIYRAHDLVLERDVAIKVLKDGAPAQREAFRADVRRAIRLSEEPNFINLYDCGPSHALAFCVQQMVDGPTLRRLLQSQARDRPLPVARLRHIFGRLTGAIARAHAMGYTYGNLKPTNIIVGADDEPFILPVGRRRDEPRDESRLNALLQRLAECRERGLAVGDGDAEELSYLVPDQFSDGVQPIDPRQVDQYMLGLIGWEMATGQCPAAVAEPHRLPELGRAAFRELPPIGSHRPLAPHRIEALLARMTQPRAARRFPDLQSVLRELDAMPDMGLLIVLDSWRRVAAEPGFESQFFARFYDAFLRRAPAARKYFAHFDADEWSLQHRLLKEAVMLLLAFHQQGDPDTEPNVLSRIADSHRRFPRALYDPFVDALLETLCGNPAEGVPPADPMCSGPRERDVLDEHWRQALQPGVDWLKARSAY